MFILRLPILALLGCLVLCAQAVGQEATAPAAKQSELALRQGRVADKYARLEQLMLKMAEIDGAANPKRAALLKQAVQQSKDNLTRSQLEAVVKLLDQQKLKRAVDGQSQATKEMKALLELLLSENRADRNRGEQDRVKEYIKEVERLIRLQKDIEGRNQGDEKTEKLAQDQAKLADRTGDLTKKIDDDSSANESAGEEQATPEQPNSQSTDQPMPKPAEQPADKPSETQPTPAGENAPSQPMPGEQTPGQPMPGQPMPGEAQPSEPGQTPMGETPAEQNPAKQRLQQAQQKMREAQKKLEEAKRNDAKADQEAARQELEKAKAELEEILRQLREEEIERTLAQLDDRFRKMIDMQVKVLQATQRLESLPMEARGREVDIESGKLAVEQRKIVLEADKAYNLLLEEGSSIAFPESVEQVRGDMEQVADRLAKTKIDSVTVGIEEDIVAALNELLKALQQAQKEQEDKKNEDQQQQAPPGEDQDQPLVDKIAELKMIKSMQLRVNERTQRFAKLIESPDDPIGQTTTDDLREAVVQLGERQSKLQRITRDIVLGKNQ